MEETLESKFDWVLDGFDFEKVHNVMTFLGWKWFTLDGVKVPSINQMKESCRELFEEVASGETDNMASGGFSVRKYGDNIVLEFILADETSEYM
jgi:hypothetical protein